MYCHSLHNYVVPWINCWQWSS